MTAPLSHSSERGVDCMKKRRGNPNWFRCESVVAVSLSSFEYEVRTLGLFPENYAGSLALRDWIRRNKGSQVCASGLVGGLGVPSRTRGLTRKRTYCG